MTAASQTERLLEDSPTYSAFERSQWHGLAERNPWVRLLLNTGLLRKPSTIPSASKLRINVTILFGAVYNNWLIFMYFQTLSLRFEVSAAQWPPGKRCFSFNIMVYLAQRRFSWSSGQNVATREGTEVELRTAYGSKQASTGQSSMKKNQHVEQRRRREGRRESYKKLAIVIEVLLYDHILWPKEVVG